MGDINALKRILSGLQEPTNLALPLLKEITENFSDDRKIGKGGFSYVYKGVLPNENIAVKRISLNERTIDDKLFDREVTNLMRMGIISHPNVVRFLGFCSDTDYEMTEDTKSGQLVMAQKRERLLCFDYISNGSLEKHISDPLRGLEWSKRYEIIKGISRGLYHLHEEKNIIHMDLTPGNIMLDNEMVPKITDFGLSRHDKNTQTSCPLYMTRGYCAPEYGNGGEPSKMADMYSLGIVITELVTGLRIHPNKEKVLRWWGYRWKKSKLSPLQLSQNQMQVTKCMEIATLCRNIELRYRPSISDITSILMGTEIMNVHAVQINNEMLGIEPLELTLPFDCQKQISREVKLTNETNDYYAFIIETPSRQYLTQPEKGILSPHSNCSIQITMQAQSTATDDFIVKSTIVDGDLRVDHMTEHMFNKEPSEVDEVNLTVVMYNPKKSQGNAYGEAISKGHCSNFHPPQSFSSNHPTNMRYLNRPSDRAVDLSVGVMGSLLHKLGELLKEFNLEASVKVDIESFSEELMKMHLVLRKLSNIELDDQDYYLVKRWANSVREMSYDIEDFVDDLLVHSDPTSDTGGFRELMHRVFNAHYLISDKIKAIKDQVQEAAKKRKEYRVDNVVDYARTEITGTIVPRMLLVPFGHHKDLVGIEEKRDDLIKRFCARGRDLQLKILSIYGYGGVGKTTLAREVYDKLRGEFHLRAFVSVGQKSDKKEVLRDIIGELNGNTENSNEEQLITELQRLLKNKSYLIVIDDIWHSSAWNRDIIKFLFLDNNCGSRVVTTTRFYSVAIACCNNSEYVYGMKTLSDKESRILLVRRIYGTEEARLDVPEEMLTGMLKKCGGLPLAIVSIASLILAKGPGLRSAWDYVSQSLVAMFEGDNPTLKQMGQILDLSYRHLPHHLKTCLLSVGKYPEDHEIEKTELLRQWIAEGIVSTTCGLDAEDVAEDYFNDLINMSMIQPGKIDYNNEVLSCRLHDIMLDLIRFKASQENFCLVIDGSKDVTQAPEKVRRASIQYHGEMDCSALTVAATSRSLVYVRSVILFSRGHYDLSSFMKLKYVRVLHLEDGTSDLNLSGISGLFQLRYLKIVCSSFETDLELPSRFEELKELETVDVRSRYPCYVDLRSIVSLPRLLHLSAGIFSGLPKGISSLKSLRTLGFNLTANSVDNIKCLGELTNLRDLTICWWVAYCIDPMDAGMRMEVLRSSIGSLSGSLRNLIIGAGCNIQVPVHGWSSAHSPPARNLRKLDLTGCDFDRCPKWIAELHDLYSLRIRVKEVADGINIVAGLHSLAYLYLKCHGEKEEMAVISGFQLLKHMDLDCEKLSLTFQAGAMPSLEKLEIWFRYNNSFVTGDFLPCGIEHLPTHTLRQICLNLVVYNNALEPADPYVREVFEMAFQRHHPSAHITSRFHLRFVRHGWRYPPLKKGK